MRILGVVAVCVLASGCVKRKVAAEPFQPVEVAADEGSLQRAFVAMIGMGMDPQVEGGSAYGAQAPIVTAWEAAGMYRTRWLVFARDGKLHVTSVCLQELKVTSSPGAAGPTSSTSSVTCPAQPVGRSKVAADLAAAIGAAPPPPVEIAPPPPEPVGPIAPVMD